MTATADELVTSNRCQTGSEQDTFTEARYRQFARHLRSAARDILDVGCNTGRGGAALKAVRADARLTGLDCVSERLSALDGAVYENAVCSLTHAIPLPSGSFDAIVAGELMEHIPPEWVFATLCEFFRLLRLRGQLLLTTPHPRYIKNRLIRSSILLERSHVSQHLPRSLRRRLEDVGYSSIRFRGSGRVTRIIGEHCPYLAAYGSYLVTAVKW
jgi:2-polyprenyl-3-methyl-5-hydroxy-6-metoxy-1,4-benzoquinol methylase